MEPTYLAAPMLASALTDAEAISELETALLGDIDPEEDAKRLFSPAPGGEFLLMPAGGTKFSGVKLVTIAPGNPAKGLPKIQGIYTLFNSRTLAPVAVMDAAELTLIRTPATTALAVKHILAARAPMHPLSAKYPVETAVVFGTGPQAWRHIRALQAVVSANTTIVVGRDYNKTESFAQYCRNQSLQVEAGDAASVASADLIICATSSSTPLFDNAVIENHAVIAAVGSHGLDAREIHPELARRASIVVESRASALREAGDLIPARSVAEWQDASLINLAELVQGKFTPNPDKPTLYTGAGMAWQDLVVASAIHDRVVLERAQH